MAKVIANSQGKVVVAGGKALKAVSPAVLEVGAVTVQTGPNTTENVAYNENVKIKGSDGRKYTLPEWNALYVAAGFDKDAMTVQPIGISAEEALEIITGGL